MKRKLIVREVGEIFKYGEVTLRVESDNLPYCEGCYFKNPRKRCTYRDRMVTGGCTEGSPRTWVKFVEVKEGGEK